MKIEYMNLYRFVDNAMTLAEGMAEDIKGRKGRISSTSVVNLGKFYASARAVQGLLDMVEVDKKDIN